MIWLCDGVIVLLLWIPPSPEGETRRGRKCSLQKSVLWYYGLGISLQVWYEMRHLYLALGDKTFFTSKYEFYVQIYFESNYQCSGLRIGQYFHTYQPQIERWDM
jgi:hypothetical protein